MKLKKLIIVSIILLGFCEILHAQNQLMTYPAPQGVELKQDFTLTVYSAATPTIVLPFTPLAWASMAVAKTSPCKTPPFGQM